MKKGYAATAAAAAQIYDIIAGMAAAFVLIFFDGAGAAALGILALIGAAFDAQAFEDAANADAKGMDTSLLALAEMLLGSALLAAAAAIVLLAPCPLPLPRLAEELGLCPTRLGRTLAVLYAAGHTAFPAALYLTRKWAAGAA